MTTRRSYKALQYMDPVSPSAELCSTENLSILRTSYKFVADLPSDEECARFRAAAYGIETVQRNENERSTEYHSRQDQVRLRFFLENRQDFPRMGRDGADCCFLGRPLPSGWRHGRFGGLARD
eukprot:scaffold1785_cov247-Pinguiococcus_pyrenoidosus.AAC.31